MRIEQMNQSQKYKIKKMNKLSNTREKKNKIKVKPNK